MFRSDLSLQQLVLEPTDWQRVGPLTNQGLPWLSILLGLESAFKSTNADGPPADLSLPLRHTVGVYTDHSRGLGTYITTSQRIRPHLEVRGLKAALEAMLVW